MRLFLWSGIKITTVIPFTDSVQMQKSAKAVVANIVFKSKDGGQTWQDISNEMPEQDNFFQDVSES